jgi:thioredoxin 1
LVGYTARNHFGHNEIKRIFFIPGGEDAMEVKEIKSSIELERAKMSGLALVDFGAPWCAPCSLQEPIIQQLAAQFKGKVLIGAVNIDESRDVALNLEIQSIPTLILFKNGIEMQRFVGLQSEDTLSEALEKLLK